MEMSKPSKKSKRPL